MSALVSTILICLAACCLVMLLIYLWAYNIKNAGVVDIFWAFNFSIIAILLYFLGDGLPQRKLGRHGCVRGVSDDDRREHQPIFKPLEAAHPSGRKPRTKDRQGSGWVTPLFLAPREERS